MLALLAARPGVAEPSKGMTLSKDRAAVRHALVIGNQNYRLVPLENPRSDAEAMADKLRALGFDVSLREDLPLRGLDRAVDEYLAGVRTGDVSLVYYSGHGVQVDGENFLIPVDFASQDERDVKYDAYPLDKLTDKLGDRSLALSIIVLDACRDNPFRAKRGGSRGLAGVNAAEGTLIAFATSPGKTASDGKRGEHGVYTASLLKALDRENVDVDDLFKQVREDVAARTERGQVPWSSSSVIGRFCLKGDGPCGNGSPSQSATTSPAVATPRIEEKPPSIPPVPTTVALSPAATTVQPAVAPPPEVAKEPVVAAPTSMAAPYEVTEGTVYDKVTKLTWQREPSRETFTWLGAQEYCAALRVADKEGWRLPTQAELITLVSKGHQPAIDVIAFPKTRADWFWTSSAGSEGQAGTVSFFSGTTSSNGASSTSNVRCVR